jgi:hypothetical protein
VGRPLTGSAWFTMFRWATVLGSTLADCHWQWQGRKQPPTPGPTTRGFAPHCRSSKFQVGPCSRIGPGRAVPALSRYHVSVILVLPGLRASSGASH